MGIVERIKSRVNISDSTGCWEWQGSKCSDGYGTITYARKTWAVHKLMYLSAVGEIGAGLEVCHECDVRHCCNPSHLFLGTHAQNIADAAAKGRMSRGSHRNTAKLTEADIPVIVKRLNAGEFQHQIAADYGVSHVSIGQIKRGQAWRHVPTDPIAARTTKKIGEQDVLEIRAMAASGQRHPEIAAKYSISEASVWNIIKGVTWKNV